MSVKGFLNNLSSDILRGVEAKLWSKIDPAKEYSTPKSSDDFQPGNIDILNITIVSSDVSRAFPFTDQVKQIQI